MMQPKEFFAIICLLIVAGRNKVHQNEICRDYSYLQDGVCKACPNRCARCISELNCTECNANYYGPFCQYTCQEDCKDHCHKVHGYCTYGCLDGLFPEPDSPLCAKCPTRCNTCKSMNECIECIPGYYGTTCENQCSSNCDSCNIITGTCLVCDERYFIQNGQCLKCADGCTSCYDSGNCFRCEEGYLEFINGRCIKDCASESTNDALNKIASEYIAAHQCLNTTKSQEFEIKTRRPCLQYIPCSSNIVCPSENNEKNGCGTIKTYQCSHVCHVTNMTDCTFVHNCTIIEQRLSSMSVCFSNKKAFSVIKLQTESECSAVPDNPLTSTNQPPTTCTNIPVIVSVIFGLLCLAMAFYIIWINKRCHNIWKSRRDTMNTEEAMVNMKSGKTRGKTLLSQSSEDEAPHNSNQSETFDPNNYTQKTELIHEETQVAETLLDQSSVESFQIDETSHTSVSRNGTMKTVRDSYPLNFQQQRNLLVSRFLIPLHKK